MIGFQQRDNAPEEPCRPFRLIPAIIANRDSALQSVLFCIHSSNSPTGWAALLPMDLQDDKNKKKKKLAGASDYWTEIHRRSIHPDQQQVAAQFQKLSFGQRLSRAELLDECELSTSAKRR